MDLSRFGPEPETSKGFAAGAEGLEYAAMHLFESLGPSVASALRSDLRVGFVDDRFAVYYQPTIRISDRAVVGLQTAVQWDNPTVGPLQPDLFLAAASVEGRYVDALRFILAQVCDDVVDWRQEGLSPGPVSVTIPVDRLADGSVLGDLMTVLRITGISPEFISLDVHEKAYAPALIDKTSPSLTELANAGFRLAVCGFGTGGASLSVLRAHAIDELKIDPGLLIGIGENTVDESIVRSIVALGKTLAADVLAAGLKNQDQLNFLRDAGCAFVQGAFIAPPMNRGDCRRWIAAQQQIHRDHLAHAGGN